MEAQGLIQSSQTILESLGSLPEHSLRLASKVGEANLEQAPVALTVKLSSDEAIAKPVATLPLYSSDSVMDILYSPDIVPQEPSSASSLAYFLATSLSNLYAEERAMIAHLLSSSPGYRPSSDVNAAAQSGMSDEFERRRTRSVKYASTYHLTFSLFTPDATPSDWQIEAALHETIKPLLNGLSPVSNFTIDTQVQPYATFSSSVHPFYDETRKAWLLKSSDLGGFINAAEWPLSPSIGAGPTINFILYVPSASQTPLLIDDSESTSWLILQWGGIALYNPAHSETVQQPAVLLKSELSDPLLTFSQHLLDLLGLPSPELPFQFRMATQVRLLSLRLISSASSTLGSLARLVQELPSISVPKSTAASVEATLLHLEASCTALQNGQFQDALHHARVADEEAEKAFFHKSMVGQVYFPDEHKVAVYLPMLGPMAVPLLMTLFREAKSLKRAKSS